MGSEVGGNTGKVPVSETWGNRSLVRAEYSYCEPKRAWEYIIPQRSSLSCCSCDSWHSCLWPCRLHMQQTDGCTKKHKLNQLDAGLNSASTWNYNSDFSSVAGKMVHLPWQECRSKNHLFSHQSLKKFFFQVYYKNYTPTSNRWGSGPLRTRNKSIFNTV